MTITKKPNSIRILVTILIVVLAAALIGGATYGIIRLVEYNKSDTKKPSLNWQVGALDVNGEYRASKGSLYTKDAFACQGLTVSLAFDNNVTYQIYFYDDDVNFISSTEVQTGNFEEKLPELASKARIVITPKDDTNISWLEKSKYCKQLDISVLKDQSHSYGSSVKLSWENWSYRPLDFKGTKDTSAPADTIYCTTTAINVSGYSKIVLHHFSPVNLYWGKADMQNYGGNFTLIHGVPTYEFEYIDIPAGVEYVRFGLRSSMWNSYPFGVWLVK